MPEFLVVNPAKRSPRSRPTRGKQSNPGPMGVLLAMANKATKKKATAGKRRNPAVKVITKYRNKAKARKAKCNPARSRNPFNVAGFGIKQIGELAVGAVGGGLSTRYLTEKILKHHNEGFVGYAGNAVVALALGWGGTKFLGQTIGTGIVAGGVGTIVQRFVDEHVSKLIPAAALAITNGESDGKGLGDISFSDYGSANLNGYYEAAYNSRLVTGPRIGSAPPAPVAMPHSRHHLDAIGA